MTDAGGPEEILDSSLWLERLRTAQHGEPLGKLGRFEVLAEVARGGQATVYRARDPIDGRIVALKRFTGFDGAGTSAHLRLRREVQAASTLSHPGIVQVLGVESDGQVPLLVLEWIDGMPLDTWGQASAGRSVREHVQLAAAIAVALVHAHQRGVIHRDLKPSNVLVDRDARPHIVDFGLAKLHGDPHRRAATSVFAGTLAYATPELVASGLAAVDARSDVYAVGVMLFESLAGRLPYDLGDSIASAVEAIRKNEPSFLGLGHVDENLRAVLGKALAKRPEDRYQSADTLHADLLHVLRDEPVSVRAPRAWDAARSLVRRHPLWSAVAGLALLGVLGFAATMATLYRDARREAARAQRVERFLATELGGLDLTALSPSDCRTLLSRASAAAGEQLGADPATEARVRGALARQHAEFANWEDVKAESRRALALIPADRAFERLEPTWTLGLALSLTGEQDGEPLLEQALATARAHDETDPAVAADVLASLAFIHGVWQPRPNLERAESEFQESFAWRRRAGTETVDWIDGLHTHAVMKIRARELEAAQASLEAALAMAVRVGSAARSRRIIVLSDYAAVLRDLGRLPDAEQAYRDAIAARNGELDDRLPPCWALLGDIVYGSGRPAEALELYETAVIVRCERLAQKLPADAPQFQRVANAVRSHGFGAGELRALEDLLSTRAPEIVPLLAYTTRRLAQIHADLDQKPESQALLAALRFVDAPLPSPRASTAGRIADQRVPR